MRVAIETTVMRGPLTGIGQYVSGLIGALTEIAAGDVELLEFDGLAVRPIASDFLATARMRNARMVDADRAVKPTSRHRLYDAYLSLRKSNLVRAAARFTKEKRFQSMSGEFDVFHAVQMMAPGPCSKPVLPVIHDLSHIRFPQFHPGERVQWLDKRLPIDAPLIQTVSNFSKQELVELTGISAERIHVSYPGIAAHFQKQARPEDEHVLARHGVASDGYFLVVSTREPRKNVASLASAYVALPAAVKQRFPLVWIGHRGWGDLALSPQVEDACRAGQIRLMGYVSDSDLASLYRRARAFIMPSLYEGFGMPVVEAMACGSALVLSDIPVFREVAGTYASYVSPLDIDGWQEAMLRAAGIARDADDHDGRDAWLQRYAWRHNAKASLELYRKLADRN